MKRQKRNIVIVGAGSAAFTIGLIADLIAHGGEWNAGLVDINEDALETACLLAGRMVKAKNAPITIQGSADRKELFPRADAIVTTIAVGGRRAWEKDVLIPRKYGIFQPVGDTIMPGGISRALRLIPQMVGIAGDAAALAPQAHFFNYSNPMAAICRAVRKATPVRVVGLCHGVMYAEQYLANFINVPFGRCDFTAVGINHLTWILGFRADGKDAWPMVKKRNEELKAADKPLGDDPDNQLSWELFESFGAFPAVLDRHVAEFFPQFHRTGGHYGKKLGVDRFSFEDTVERGDKGFARMAEYAYGKIPLDEFMFHKSAGEYEQVVCILDALEKDDGRVFSVIIPNAGQVSNLPADFVLECPARISRRGISPLEIGEIPTGIRATLEKAFLTIELTVEAALERDRKKFVQALIVDGSVDSEKDANALADELIDAHREYLPGW